MNTVPKYEENKLWSMVNMFYLILSIKVTLFSQTAPRSPWSMLVFPIMLYGSATPPHHLQEEKINMLNQNK